jgi:molybdopterin converting factor small subunit
MKITIHYLAQLKRFAGVSSEVVDAGAGCTLLTLLRQAADRHGGSFRAGVFDAEGRVHPSLLFFIGDKQVQADTAAPLRDGDEVTLLSPMAGGQA